MKKKNLLLLIGFFTCSLLFAQNNKVKKQVNHNIYSAKIFPNPDQSYGYDILNQNKVLIHQQNIPGEAGLKGFSKKNDAEKVAQLVIHKLSQGIMPPTISKQDLQKLKINL